MNRVGASLLPPVGPTAVPVTSSASHSIEFGATYLGSVEPDFLFAQTRLESFECCHVAWNVSIRYGFWLRKCVRSCSNTVSKTVACGPRKNQSSPPPVAGAQM